MLRYFYGGRVMPNCRNCGTRLTKFDKDICPVCGETLPLKGVKSETVEITSEIDLSNPEFSNYSPKRRNIVFILFVLLGFTGAPFYYLRKAKVGIIWALINVVLCVGLIFLFSLALGLGFIFGTIIPVIILLLINIIPGIFYLIKNDIKDGHGEFIR